MRRQIKVKYLAFMSFFVAISLFPQSAQAAVCDPVAREESNVPIFQNLKGFNLYIYYSPRLGRAIKCHGNEASCAHSSNVIDRLKDDYEVLPSALLPENIESTILQNMQNGMMPLIAPDKDCQVRPIKILNKENFMAAVREPDILTITIKIEDDTNDDITREISQLIFSRFTFRSDGDSTYDTQVLGAGYFGILNLDQSDAAIAKQLNMILDRSRTRYVMYKSSITR